MSSSSARQNVFSGTSWEDAVGYSRAVRIGNRIVVSGTTAVDAGGKVASPGDAGGQTRFIIDKIETGLAACGGSLSDVVRTRIRPAATMVEVSRLIDPDLLVEIDVDAELTA
jgi:enamine deaminase RidA (YjgF/YER057c/UK114 family)